MERGSCSHRRVSSTFAPEMTFVVQYFLLMLAFQIFMHILMFLQKSLFLDFPVSNSLVKQSFVSFPKIGELNILFSFQCIQSSVNSFISFLEPRPFLLFLHLCDLMLNFVRFGKTKFHKYYFFCLTMCSSIFRRLSS
jgi:hypothetical protein